MKKINMSLILNLIALLFLISTFFMDQFESWFLTRIVLIIFTMVLLGIELKKDYFIAKKTLFIFLSVAIVIILLLSILFEISNSNNTNNKIYVVPIYVFALIVMMYKDLYGNEKPVL